MTSTIWKMFWGCYLIGFWLDFDLLLREEPGLSHSSDLQVTISYLLQSRGCLVKEAWILSPARHVLFTAYFHFLSFPTCHVDSVMHHTVILEERKSISRVDPALNGAGRQHGRIMTHVPSVLLTELSSDREASTMTMIWYQLPDRKKVKSQCFLFVVCWCCFKSPKKRKRPRASISSAPSPNSLEREQTGLTAPVRCSWSSQVSGSPFVFSQLQQTVAQQAKASIISLQTDTLPCRHIDGRSLCIPPAKRIDSTSIHVWSAAGSSRRSPPSRTHSQYSQEWKAWRCRARGWRAAGGAGPDWLSWYPIGWGTSWTTVELRREACDGMNTGRQCHQNRHCIPLFDVLQIPVKRRNFSQVTLSWHLCISFSLTIYIKYHHGCSVESATLQNIIFQQFPANYGASKC